MEALATAQLKELYRKFREISPWKKWHQSFISDVEYFKALSEEEFLEPKNQEKLWRARGIATIGPGEAVNVRGAYIDEDIANQLLVIRNKVWPEDPRKRAKAMNDAFDQIMGLVNNRHSSQRPLAKQSRLFTALHPADLHTCFTWKARRRLQDLILGSKNFEFSEGGVLVRARLREALGKEEGLDETVWRAMFCWWLYEEYDVIKRGDNLTVAPSLVPVVEDEEESGNLLDIWPVSKQRKGFPAIAGYLESLRMVISAARGGATPEDIVETMMGVADFSNYSAKSCRMVFNLVRTLGFLENRDGLWHPSDDGEQLVDDDPADILVEKLLVQTYGMAHILKQISENQSVKKKVLYSYIRGLWPGWTSDFMPSALASWLRSLGLATVDDNGSYVLSEYGGYWLKRLPAQENLPRFVPQFFDDDEALVSETSESRGGKPFEGVNFAAIWHEFQQDEKLKKFVFAREQVEALHLAWHCNPQKRFVLLSGLSGTGKTALLLHYARIYCQLKGLKTKEHWSIVAVSPDWRDPSGLLGYFNALHADPTFQAEPALRIVIAAARNPELPYFLTLDEMNLARVERYFAPFLSSMETGEDLVLHAHDETVNGVPPRISWPANLFVGGTVNMDETTHPFSDKVLDRAFTLEFWDVQLKKFFDGRAAASGGERLPLIEDLLLQVNGHLSKVRRHFGYRTAGEVLDFICEAEGVSNPDGTRLWGLADQAFFSKILPRVRGEESPALIDVLQQVHNLCTQNGMMQCANKLEVMQDRLKSTGVTRFWS
jgi:hypothetical protein